MERLKNIVILKDLPSNLIEEAFVILKNNQTAKKIEYTENKKGFISEKSGEEDNDFIIKEAELLINDYMMDDCGEENNEKDRSYKVKYKRCKKLNILLSCILFFMTLVILI